MRNNTDLEERLKQKLSEWTNSKQKFYREWFKENLKTINEIYCQKPVNISITALGIFYWDRKIIKNIYFDENDNLFIKDIKTGICGTIGFGYCEFNGQDLVRRTCDIKDSYGINIHGSSSLLLPEHESFVQITF